MSGNMIDATLEPKITSSTWENVYQRYTSVYKHNSRETADEFAVEMFVPRIAVLRRDFYEDGTCKATLEDV